mmetsp:Transcript_22780/g.47547  ORF Transcript_22780/g.47547 Transcript_22780/m.47547 type:complete len:263 (+) Transcript_22780:70-858(+)
MGHRQSMKCSLFQTLIGAKCEPLRQRFPSLSLAFLCFLLHFCCFFSLLLPCQTFRCQLLHQILVEVPIIIYILHIQIGKLCQEVVHHSPFQRALHFPPRLFIIHIIRVLSLLGCLILETLHLLLDLVCWHLNVLQPGNLVDCHANLKVPHNIWLLDILVFAKVFGVDQLLDILVCHAARAHIGHEHGVLLARLVGHERVGDLGVHDSGQGLGQSLITGAHVLLGVLGVDGLAELLLERFGGEFRANLGSEFICDFGEDAFGG